MKQAIKQNNKGTGLKTGYQVPSKAREEKLKTKIAKIEAVLQVKNRERFSAG